MASHKDSIESVIIAMLTANTTLSALSIKHFDEDAATLKDRIVATAGEPTAYLGSFREDVPPKFWQSELSVTIHYATRTEATMDTWDAAIDTAMDSAPAAAVTLANASFPTGFRIMCIDSGQRQGEGSEQRMRVKMYRVIFGL